MEDDRISILDDRAPDADGRYVLYWMQQSQRAVFNPALEYAARSANDCGLGLIVGFGLMTDYPEANARHFAFMLQGLADVAESLKERGIRFVVRLGRPDEVAIELGRDAALIVCDRGYLRHQRQWRRRVARKSGKRVVQVEGDVVVPVESVSDKAEYAARTIRPKLEKRWPNYLSALSETEVTESSLRLRVKSDLDVTRWQAALDKLALDGDVAPVAFAGGYGEASRRLTAFLRRGLDGYDKGRNDPAAPQTSQMSPYLHFGQISPVEIAMKISAAKSGGRDDRDAYLEELIVRRELAMNFVQFCDDYDRYRAIPGWAKKSLAEHADDPRPHRYTRAELEGADTHDRAWNAAMTEAKKTGFMHNYMRMYWGKKILEWSNTPEYAYRTMLYLMNRYFLDGRDPNSYTGVGWVFGLHDRAWQEREVYGKVRTMTAAGLERKFDVDGYVKRVDDL